MEKNTGKEEVIISKFDVENKLFYMVDHGDGEYSLCLPLLDGKIVVYEEHKNSWNSFLKITTAESKPFR